MSPTVPNQNSENAKQPHSLGSYAQALEALFQRINFEKIGHAPYTVNHYRLERMRHLLRLLGNPQNQYQIAHIAGTKGKGSTAILLAHALQAAGQRTGIYTSPHLKKLEERFQVDGQPASEAETIGLTERVLSAELDLQAATGERATFFELTTAMGMLFFADRQVDVAVLEVGLGGRLDSTNVCSPKTTVITSISLDHQAQLGNTIELIAREKAGIIKPKVPVICTATAPQAQHVIEQVAEEQDAELLLIGRDFETNWSLSSQLAEVEFSSSHPILAAYCGTWRTSLLGEHQAANVAGAVAALATMLNESKTLDLNAVKNQIALACPPARLQRVDDEAAIFIDTAHNPASIQATLAALETHFPARDIHCVFASSKDKDVAGMLRHLLVSCESLLLTTYRDNPRGMPVDELERMTVNLSRELSETNNPTAKCSFHLNPLEAWQSAKERGADTGVTVATGSFFLAAELID